MRQSLETKDSKQIIRHIQMLLPKEVPHCIFYLMSREMLVLFIHCSCDKIHSWHAVNQAFSQDFVSGTPLKEYGLEGWGCPIPLGGLGHAPTRKRLQT